MEKSLILETTFLIDLEREIRSGTEGRSYLFLQQYGDYRLYIDQVIAGELASGKTMSSRDKWEAYIQPFFVLEQTKDVAWEYGRIFRFLQDNGIMISGNDLWIAATGLAYSIPVVTRNEVHFKRVPGLEVLTY